MSTLTEAGATFEDRDCEYKEAAERADAAEAEVAMAQAAVERDPTQAAAKKVVAARRELEIAGELLAACTKRRLAAKNEVHRLERAEQENALREAVARASHKRLVEKTAPARARLLQLYAEVAATVAELEGAAREQHDALREATEIAATVGVHANAPSLVPVTLVRALVGLEIARELYANGAQFEVGREPWTWIAARPEPPSASPRRDEWMRARAALGDDSYMPSPRVDWHADLSTIEFFHRSTPNGRPQRHEVSP